MKVREKMGTRLRTMVKMKVTKKIWEGGARGQVRGRGVIERVVTTCAITVYTSV